jgi:hypothetical protein
MRRAVATGVLGAVLVGLLTFASAAAPAAACGCGGVVGPPDSAVSVSNERAIIHWDGGKETIELMVDMASDSNTAGIIIPTPFVPEVSAGDARTFELIESSIVPTTHIETDWWGLGYLMPDPVETVADTFTRVRVGPLEATTIAAEDTASLDTWLAVNNFEISPDLAKSLSGYAELGWSLTAIKLTNETGLGGHIDPIRLSFETDRLVYPMRLAKSEKTPQSVRLYVFDKQRTGVSKANSPTVSLDADVTVAWSGATEDQRLLALGSYLTVFDIRYDDPPKQATSDIGVVYSLSESDVRPKTVHYRMITLLGIPVGTLIVLWTALGLTLALGHVVGRRRAR